MDWTERVDRLLYDGETERRRLEVGDATVVVTSHRVLAFTPASRPRYRYVDRPNVGSVGVESTGRPRHLLRAASAAVLGAGGAAVALLGGLAGFVPETSLENAPEPTDGTSVPGQAITRDIFAAIETTLALVDLAIAVGSAVALALAVVLFAAYVRSRSRILVIEVYGDDDIEIPVGAAAVGTAAIELQNEIHPDATVVDGLEGVEIDADDRPDGRTVPFEPEGADPLADDDPSTETIDPFADGDTVAGGGRSDGFERARSPPETDPEPDQFGPSADAGDQRGEEFARGADDGRTNTGGFVFGDDATGSQTEGLRDENWEPLSEDGASEPLTEEGASEPLTDIGLADERGTGTESSAGETDGDVRDSGGGEDGAADDGGEDGAVDDGGAWDGAADDGGVWDDAFGADDRASDGGEETGDGTELGSSDAGRESGDGMEPDSSDTDGDRP